MRTFAKRRVEEVLCAARLPALGRWLHRSEVVILAYHNIVPRGAAHHGENSLHVGQEHFAQQLDLLQRTHEVVDLDSLWRGFSSRWPRAVITFDDACRGAVTAGVEELAKRELPATIFVAPDLLDRGPFWWDAIADGSGTLPPGAREYALNRLGGRPEAVREWAQNAGIQFRNVPEHQHGASEAELARAVGSGLVSLGAHSWSHPDLTSLDDVELSAELARPWQWLSEKFKRVTPWLAYPYGRSSQRVEAAARTAGYEGALLIEGGLASEHHAGSKYRIPRVNVPVGVSLRGFELRLAGIVH